MRGVRSVLALVAALFLAKYTHAQFIPFISVSNDAQEGYGSYVKQSSNFLLVGAGLDMAFADSLYIYRKDPAYPYVAPVLFQTLTGADFSFFASAFDISEDERTLVVGASGDNVVSLYHLNAQGTSFDLVANLPGPTNSTTFGSSLFVNSQILLCGASDTDEVYVYPVDSSTGQIGSTTPLVVTLPSTLGFGVSLYVQNDTIVVGSYLSDEAFLFRYTPPTLPLVEGDVGSVVKIGPTLAPTSSGSYFGFAVAYYNSTLAVSAPNVDSPEGTDEVFLYTVGFNETTRNETLVLFETLTGPSAFAYFGHSLAMHENILAVGAYGVDSVFVYMITSNSVGSVKLLQTLIGGTGSWFGLSVAMNFDGEIAVASYLSNQAFTFGPCPYGTYLETTSDGGSSTYECLLCPPGSVSSPREGYFSLPGAQSCEPCLAGTYCPAVTCGVLPDGVWSGYLVNKGLGLVDTVGCMNNAVVLAKVNGAASTFAYKAPAWTDNSRVFGDMSTNQIESRTAAYENLELLSLKMGFAPLFNASAPWLSNDVREWLNMPLGKAYPNLLTIFQDQKPIYSFVARSDFDAALGNVLAGSGEGNCNLNGIMPEAGSSCMIGLVGNNELDCLTADASEGFGCKASGVYSNLKSQYTSAGAVQSCCTPYYAPWYQKPINAPSFGYLLGVGPLDTNTLGPFVCPQGTFSGNESSACTNCPRGSYSEVVGATDKSVCQICPAGTYAPSPGQSGCVTCGPGTYSAANSTSCSLCPPGSFSNAYGAIDVSTCTVCSAGQYQHFPGSTACNTCEAGGWSLSNATHCSKCAGGTYSVYVGATDPSVCESCPPGSYATAGSTTCTLCSPGSVSTGKADACTICSNPGSYSAQGETMCHACEPGRFCQVVQCSNLADGPYHGYSLGNGKPLIDVTCASGGVLLAKIDGRLSNWAYMSPLWLEDDATLDSMSISTNQGSTLLDQTEARLAPFSELDILGIKVGFAPLFPFEESIATPHVRKWLSIPLAANIMTKFNQRLNFLSMLRSYQIQHTVAALEWANVPRYEWDAAVGNTVPVSTYTSTCNLNGIEIEVESPCMVGIAGSRAPAYGCGVNVAAEGLGCVDEGSFYSKPSRPVSAGYAMSYFSETVPSFGYIVGVERNLTFGLQNDYCPAGSYSHENATSCTSCPLTTYSPVVGASNITTCVECPQGSYAAPDFPVSHNLYMRFKADDYDAHAKVWRDSSGNGRDANLVTGNPVVVQHYGGVGATGTFPVVSGTINDMIDLKNDVLQSYTFFHVTRYSSGNKGRIFTSNIYPNNWLSCFWQGSTGVAYHDGWLTYPYMYNFGNNFVLSTDYAYQYRANSVSQVIYPNTGDVFLPPMAINDFWGGGEKSDWEIAEIAIFDTQLTTDEIIAVEMYLSSRYGLNGQGSFSIASTTGFNTHCQTCSDGYVTMGGNNHCDVCPGGTYAFQSSSCVVCDAGSYSTSGAMSCSQCPPGTYSAANSTSCTLCPAGFTNPNYGSSNCPIVCTPGTYAPEGSQYCQQCAAGTFNAKNNASSCEVCAAGSYSIMASSECHGCPPGFQCPRASCSDLADGLYHNYTIAEGVIGDVTCVQGGVLLAKIDGRSNVWNYLNPIWTEPSFEYNSDKIAFDQTEARLAPFSEMSINAVKIGFAPFYTTSVKSPSIYKWLTLPLPATAPSLLSVFADGTNVPTSISRSDWDASMNNIMHWTGEDNCNANGFRVQTQSPCMIGLSGNNEGDCNSDDAAEGLGCAVWYHNTYWGTSYISAGVQQNAVVYLRAPFFGYVVGVSSTDKAASAPIVCGAGTYSHANALQCTSCPAGTYSVAEAANDAGTCIPCPTNMYSAEGSSSCSPCSLGSFSASGAVSCSLCEAGLWADADGVCQICPIGSFCPRPTCASLPDGLYDNYRGPAAVAPAPKSLNEHAFLYVDAASSESFPDDGTGLWYDLGYGKNNMTLSIGVVYDNTTQSMVLMSGEYITTTTERLVTNMSARTLSFWINFNDMSVTAGGFGMKVNSAADNFETIDFNEAKTGWMFGSSNFYRSYNEMGDGSNIDTKPGVWMMMTAVYSAGARGYSMYKNGELAFSFPGDKLQKFKFPTCIFIGPRTFDQSNVFDASQSCAPTTLYGGLDAKIGEAQVWEFALTPKQVKQQYLATNARYLAEADSTTFSGAFTCAGGGVLLAKVDGSKPTWNYLNSIWSDQETFLNPFSNSIDQTEAKLAPYDSMPITAIKIGFAPLINASASTAIPPVYKWLELPLPAVAPSLRWQMAVGQVVNGNNTRFTWDSAIGDGGLSASGEPNCNAQGIYSSILTISPCMIGLSANDQNDCSSNDASEGLGCGYHLGSVDQAMVSAGTLSPTGRIARFGYIVGVDAKHAYNMLGPIFCPAGTFAANQSQSACTPCPGGTFSLATGATNASVCASCPINTFSPPGSSHCTKCPFAMISLGGAEKCFSCPAGTTSMPGTTNCVACPPGWACTGNSTFACPPGRFTASLNATTCTLCPANKFSVITAATNASVCTNCSFPFISDPGATSCYTHAPSPAPSFPVTNAPTYRGNPPEDATIMAVSQTMTASIDIWDAYLANKFTYEQAIISAVILSLSSSVAKLPYSAVSNFAVREGGTAASSGRRRLQANDHQLIVTYTITANIYGVTYPLLSSALKTATTGSAFINALKYYANQLGATGLSSVTGVTTKTVDKNPRIKPKSLEETGVINTGYTSFLGVVAGLAVVCCVALWKYRSLISVPAMGSSHHLSEPTGNALVSSTNAMTTINSHALAETRQATTTTTAKRSSKLVKNPILHFSPIDMCTSIFLALITAAANFTQAHYDLNGGELSAMGGCILFFRLMTALIALGIIYACFKQPWLREHCQVELLNAHEHKYLWMSFSALALFDPTMVRFLPWKESEFSHASLGFCNFSLFIVTTVLTLFNLLLMTGLSSASLSNISQEMQTYDLSFALSFLCLVLHTVNLAYRLLVKRIQTIVVAVEFGLSLGYVPPPTASSSDAASASTTSATSKPASIEFKSMFDDKGNLLLDEIPSSLSETDDACDAKREKKAAVAASIDAPPPMARRLEHYYEPMA